MAPDTRTRILQAAKTLAEANDSVQGVIISLESVALEAGLTKPGLMYHFPSKEALMLGLVDHAAEDWARRLREHTGADAAQLTAFDRHRAYVTVATSAGISRADYWIFSDALYHPRLAGAWHARLEPWFDLSGLGLATRSLLTTARFCADGAWMSEATGVFPAEDLSAVRSHALGLIAAAEAQGSDAAEAQGSDVAGTQGSDVAGTQGSDVAGTQGSDVAGTQEAASSPAEAST